MVSERQKQELEKLTHDMVYTTMVASTEVARMFCREHPDLLNVIGNAIWKRICEGDVYHDIVRTMIEADPHFFADMLKDVLEQVKESHS